MKSKFILTDNFTGEVLEIIIGTMKEAREAKKIIEDVTGCYVDMEKQLIL